MTIGALVFARLDSSRVPGKVLADLGGCTVLDRVLARVGRVEELDRIVVATSARTVDDPIAEHVEGLAKVELYRGSGPDVLGRCAQAAHHFGLDVAVRISADSPFVDPAVVRQVVRAGGPGVDLATNVFPRSWPIGCSAEALSRDCLDRLDEEVDGPAYREHITLWVYDHAEDYCVHSVTLGDDRFCSVSIAVDDPVDLERARWIVAQVDDPDSLSVDEVVLKWAGAPA